MLSEQHDCATKGRAIGPARLIDLTRLVSRLGHGPLTGIDRVEAAWLGHFLRDTAPLFALVRTALGYVLLDRQGAQMVAGLAKGAALGKPDLLGRLIHRQDKQRGRAEATIRRIALARSIRARLAPMLRRHMPQAFDYFNLGHANLANSTMRGLRAGGARRIVVLIHDTIPLDHPEFTRPGIGAVFARKLAAVANHADLVIHSAHATRQANEAQLARMGRVPDGLVSHLGVDRPVPAEMPPRDHPYFVTIGTIEPRKNHALLLDVWEELHQRLPAEKIPHLLILGTRGWSNAPVFERLDHAHFMGKTVFEMPGLADDQVAGLLAGAQGLLFPSRAEGYGLPPLEAAALGVAVIAARLPVYDEILKNYPIYLDETDSYSWVETIIALSDSQCNGERAVDMRRPARPVPGWDEHVNTVLTLMR